MTERALTPHSHLVVVHSLGNRRDPHFESCCLLPHSLLDPSVAATLSAYIEAAWMGPSERR